LIGWLASVSKGQEESLRHQYTKIAENYVEIRYADDPEKDLALEWMEIRFPLTRVGHTGAEGRSPQRPESRPVSEIQADILLHAQGLLAAEIGRLRANSNR
jgi:hypothetical protein